MCDAMRCGHGRGRGHSRGHGSGHGHRYRVAAEIAAQQGKAEFRLLDLRDETALHPSLAPLAIPKKSLLVPADLLPSAGPCAFCGEAAHGGGRSVARSCALGQQWLLALRII